MATGCAGLPIAGGSAALAALVERTRQDPWWAVVGAIMHAGPVTYDPQQVFVDRIATRGHRHLLDLVNAIDAVYNLRFTLQELAALPSALRRIGHAQLWPTRAAMLHVAAGLYDHWTAGGTRPEAILDPTLRRTFTFELRYRLAMDTAGVYGRMLLAWMGKGDFHLPVWFRSFPVPEGARGPVRRTRSVKQKALFGLGDDTDDAPVAEGDDATEGPEVATSDADPDEKKLLARIAKDRRERRKANEDPWPAYLLERGWKPPGGGIGPKAGALLMEYLGDPDAVAADRHVSYWAFRSGVNNGGLLHKPYRHLGWAKDGRTTSFDPSEFVRTDELTPEMFVRVQRIVRREAKACGVAPAALQVAAWAWGVCTSEQRGATAIRIFGSADMPCSGFVQQAQTQLWR